MSGTLKEQTVNDQKGKRSIALLSLHFRKRIEVTQLAEIANLFFILVLVAIQTKDRPFGGYIFDSYSDALGVASRKTRRKGRVSRLLVHMACQ